MIDMTTKRACSDFGLYTEKWKREDFKKWLTVLVACGVFLAGFGVFYSVIIIFLKNIDEPIEIENISAEKLIRPIPINGMSDFPPRPFEMTFKQPPPSVFRPTTSTEKVTTISYPQLGSYRHRNYHPRNIQDILKYASTTKMGQYDTFQNYDKSKIGETYRRNQYQSIYNRNLNNQEMFFGNNDPFFPYKPQDPSDINLMATGSFRFAPPAWKSLQKAIPVRASQINYKHPQINKSTKPVALTLNVFPMMEGDKLLGFNIFNKIMDNKDSSGQSLAHKVMILKLNIYPEDINNFT